MTTFTTDTIRDFSNSLRDGEAGSEGGAPISIATTAQASDIAQSKPHKTAANLTSVTTSASPEWVEYFCPNLPRASRWLFEGEQLVGIAIQRRRGRPLSKRAAADGTSDEQQHVNIADSGCDCFDGNKPEFSVGAANLSLAVESCNRFFRIGDDEPHYMFVITAGVSYLIAGDERSFVAVQIEATVTRPGVCEYPTRAMQAFKFLPQGDTVRITTQEEDCIERVGTTRRTVRINYATDQGAEHEAVVPLPCRSDCIAWLMATLGDEQAGVIVCHLQGSGRFTSTVEKLIRNERINKIIATLTASHVAIAVGGLRIGWHRKPTPMELLEQLSPRP